MNVIESVERDFLACVQELGADDKLSVAERLGERLASRLDARANEIARLELLLLYARLEASGGKPEAPRSDDDELMLARDVRIAHVDHRAYEAHEMLPAHDMPHEERRPLLDAALARLSGELVPGPVAAVPSRDGTDGAIILLDDSVCEAFERLRASPTKRGALAASLPADQIDALIAIGAIGKARS